MKINDRLFIFLSVALILLFTVKILENVFFSTSLEEYKDTILFERAAKPRVENKMSEILTGLEQKGLEPQKARFYRIIDE